MSEAALAAHKAGKVRVAIGPASISSARSRWIPGWRRVFLPAFQGKAAQTAGDPDALHTYTFIDDFGKALVVLGERDEALGQAWHVPNPETLTTRQVVDLIFQEIGQPAKLSTMGKMMMRIGGIFIPGAREMVEMMYEFEKPFVVDSSKFAKAFGMEATPWEAALRETVLGTGNTPRRRRRNEPLRIGTGRADDRLPRSRVGRTGARRPTALRVPGPRGRPGRSLVAPSWRSARRIGVAFDGFDPAKVAPYDDAKVAELLANPGIVRNRLKIAAAMANARAFLASPGRVRQLRRLRLALRRRPAAAESWRAMQRHARHQS